MITLSPTLIFMEIFTIFTKEFFYPQNTFNNFFKVQYGTIKNGDSDIQYQEEKSILSKRHLEKL